MVRKFFAGLLISIFIILSFPFVSFFGIYDTFFDRDFYENEFLDILYEFAVKTIPDQFPLENLPVDISKEEFEDLLKDIFTKEDLKNTISDIIDQIQTLRVSKNNTIDFSLSLAFINEKRDMILDTVSQLIIDKLPACETPPEALSSIDDLNCIPEGIMVSDLKKQMEIALDDDLFKDFNDQVVFSLNAPEDISFDNLSYDFNDLLYTVLLISILILVFILGLIALLIFSPFIRILKWEAKTIFLASLFNLSAYVLLFYLFDKITVPTEMETFFNIYSFIIKSLAKSVFHYLVPIFIVSLIVWIIAIIYDKNEPVIIK